MSTERTGACLLEMAFPDHTHLLGTLCGGQLVELVGGVVGVGRSSMHVEVEMTAEDPLNGDRRVCASGRFVMIARDSKGSPITVPAMSLPA